MKDKEVKICTKEDIWYPNGMRELSGMPHILYYKGNIEIINRRKNVAIIGGRRASEKGLKLAYETGRMASERGYNVVNGLALGCDAEAIKGALSVEGACVAVMPCGLEQIQPKSNTVLAEKILENGGCLISQYPVGTVIRDYLYVERDRLQSGMSQGVMIVEAQEKSGTMHTAEFAMKQYRRLACYYHKFVEGAQGNKRLEDSGKAQVVRTKRDLENFFDRVGNEDSYVQMILDI